MCGKKQKFIGIQLLPHIFRPNTTVIICSGRNTTSGWSIGDGQLKLFAEVAPVEWKLSVGTTKSLATTLHTPIGQTRTKAPGTIASRLRTKTSKLSPSPAKEEVMTP